MIAKLTGTISDIFTNFIILDVNGVGYKVTLPTGLLEKAKLGSKSTYYIYTHVKEDALALFGFTSKKELAFFELLLTVSNIGPKTALSVMNLGSVEEIISAISKADSEYFLGVPRVGRKNAQRIIVELRSKIGAVEDIDLTFEGGKQQRELYDALLGFGFEKAQIKETIKRLPEEGSIEDKIKFALKSMGRKQ